MNVNDRTITLLRENVKAAHQEFDLAIRFHEAWKPAAYDEGLHNRMGVSYATHTFHVVRLALRQEMFLALMRLWDRGRKNIGMEAVAKTLRDKYVIEALAAERVASIPMAEAEVKQSLSQFAQEAIVLVDKYSKGGTQCAVLKNLRDLRHQRLAHRQVKAAVTGAGATDKEIEFFYQDTLKLISLLLHVVGVAYDPEEFAQVYRLYAKHFWAGVRGEQTEGHPNYRVIKS